MAVAAPLAASRLAPSPTGPLHVGNACTFLVNWALARKLGWRLHLRIEDLDTARVQAAATEAEVDLAWLGVDHDGPPVRQSDRMPLYHQAMEALAAAGLVYQSPHSRAEVREAAAALSAPHQPAGAPFPHTLRPPPGPAWGFARADVNHRLRVDPGDIAVQDQLHGLSTFHPAQSEGDFIVWTKSGYPAYQLAVVVDDAAQGVTDVVRGQDLLPSAALQTLIYRALGKPAPRWWHLPLVTDAAGQRLAKRAGSYSLTHLRQTGTPPERVVGLVAWWCGAQPSLQPMDAARLPAALHPSMLRVWAARAAHQPPSLTDPILEWLHTGSAPASSL
ncbi:MAG: glutamate--tRNA ligase family protein [Phycisphaerales bacterium]